MNKLRVAIIVPFIIIVVLQFISCNKESIAFENSISFRQNLSEYGIYTGKSGSLVYSSSYHLYELATPLFSDYAEKQRLIYVPPGTKLTGEDDGLFNFPDSTIIIKTFFYYQDKRDTAAGKNILETRFLIKYNGIWNAATYIWNKEQTDATLITSGTDVAANWIDEDGKPQAVNYRVPGKTDCGKCHQSYDNITPIGLKVRNTNINIVYNGTTFSQLDHLQNQGILVPLNANDYAQLPNWQDASYSLEQRARAYLDINCSHCHSDGGFAKDIHLRLGSEVPLENSGIKSETQAIGHLMSKGQMPLIGTTLVHEEGLQLIKNYLQTLK